MANPNHLQLLMRGVFSWNQVQYLAVYGFKISDEELAEAARVSGIAHNVKIDLSDIDLASIDLSGINLSNANLSGANLSSCNLDQAELRNTNLSNAELTYASLVEADLEDADLRGAKLLGAQLHGASLAGVVLEAADIRGAVLDNASVERSSWSEFERRFWLERGGRISSAGGRERAGRISEQTYDVFISHASEDKEAIARPLHAALIEKGVTVWFDEDTLKLGDSLRRTIDAGLAQCRYGIVILSPSFLQKEWPQRELDGLVARETSSGEKAIIPIWHKLDKGTLINYSSPLADRLAALSSEGVPALVDKILRVLRR